jgi:hypothetical protein
MTTSLMEASLWTTLRLKRPYKEIMLAMECKVRYFMSSAALLLVLVQVQVRV